MTALAVVAAPAAAFASHYRSVYSTVGATGTTVNWTVTNATKADGSAGEFADGIGIRQLGSTSDSVDSGTDTGFEFVYGDLGAVEDLSNPLWAQMTEYFTADASVLEDGLYEAYVSTRDRLEGVQNTNGESNISAWIRFSTIGGLVNLPPRFNAPSLYQLIAPNGTVTADFRATDPEGGAVTYTLLTDSSQPVYAGTAIPCSSFSAGVLTIGPAQCTGGDVFANIFNTSVYGGDVPSWTAKVAATDASGNVATSDVLFRMLSKPVPTIDYDQLVSGTDYELYINAPDSGFDYLSVECVNNADPTDIATAEGTASPLTVRNLTIAAEYTCSPFASNAAGGSVDEETYGLGPVAGLVLVLALQVGVDFGGASSNIAGGLKASSNYSLTMYSDPIVIYAGTTDGDGNFDEDITIPASACIPGIHHLILLGVDVNDQPIQDEQWVEIGNNCEVLRFSDTQLADTGFDAASGLMAGISLAVLGGALVVYRRRTQLV